MLRRFANLPDPTIAYFRAIRLKPKLLFLAESTLGGAGARTFDGKSADATTLEGPILPTTGTLGFVNDGFIFSCHVCPEFL